MNCCGDIQTDTGHRGRGPYPGAADAAPVHLRAGGGLFLLLIIHRHRQARDLFAGTVLAARPVLPVLRHPVRARPADRGVGAGETALLVQAAAAAMGPERRQGAGDHHRAEEGGTRADQRVEPGRGRKPAESTGHDD